MTPAAGERLSPIDCALAAAALLLALAVTLPALRLLSLIWTSSELYAHGYLIPVVALVIAASRWQSLRQELGRLRPPLCGPPLVLLVGVLEWALVAGDAGFVAGLGVPVVLATTVYAIGGSRLLRILAAPIAFLALMVPPPRFLTYQALFQLKLFVTDVSVGVLQALGQTVTAQGNEILLPGHTLFVADACSGLNSVIALTPLSVVATYFLNRGVWRRIVVVGSTLPLAILANVVRLVVVILLVPTLGMAHVEGLLHESFGLSTYLVGALVLFLLARALR